MPAVDGLAPLVMGAVVRGAKVLGKLENAWEIKIDVNFRHTCRSLIFSAPRNTNETIVVGALAEAVRATGWSLVVSPVRSMTAADLAGAETLLVVAALNQAVNCDETWAADEIDRKLKIFTETNVIKGISERRLKVKPRKWRFAVQNRSQRGVLNNAIKIYGHS